MPDEKERVRESHYQIMKYLQDMRTDVKNILDDTINRHYEFPPEIEDGWKQEQYKLRQDLLEVQSRIDRTLRAL